MCLGTDIHVTKAKRIFLWLKKTVAPIEYNETLQSTWGCVV